MSDETFDAPPIAADSWAASRGHRPDPEEILAGRRMVLVSNREPYVREVSEEAGGKIVFRRTMGGLVTALDPVMRRCQGVWVAWKPGADPETEPRHQVPTEPPRFTLRQVPLSTPEVRRYYYGFANRALWPLCHYFIEHCSFDVEQWRQYEAINQRFADATLEEAREGDFIWVHDYHFCLLPAMLRRRRGEAGPIAYFHHIPFPAEEVFKILPWRRQVLEGMLGADLVGFHVPSYAGHFLGACQRQLATEVDFERGLVAWQGRQVRVVALPIGIDVAEFHRLATREETARRAETIRQRLGVDNLVIGVDRLDYSKGIPERLAAIEHLLETRPELRRRFVFLQIAVPSRTRVAEYQRLKRRIDETVGDINGRFGDADWQPVSYLYRALPREELVAYYRAADVAFLTPLRDGLNLVALEYCACQGEDSAGALVLSEFTGASQLLDEGALLVNPFEPRLLAQRLMEAMTMERGERRRRLAALRRTVLATDVNDWLGRMLEVALAPHGVGAGSGG